MADELTGTGNFGASKETDERDVDLPDPDTEARDLTEDPLTDEEQGNEDIHKPTEGTSEGSDTASE
jgi:hypothetical protein